MTGPAEPIGDGSGEPSRKRQKTPVNSIQRPPREIGFMRNTPNEKFASFVGSSSGIFFIRSVYSATKNQSNSGANIQTPGSDLIPGEDDRLSAAFFSSQAKFLWLPEEVTAHPSPGMPPPTFDDLMNWSQSYFDNWHRAYPHLHAPSVLEHFEHIAKNGLSDNSSAPAFETIILRSIMSISIADRRQTGRPAGKPVPAEFVFESQRSGTDCLQRVMSEPASLLSLQAAISVLLFQVSMLRYNSASRLEGLCVRLAFQLGLHRCPVRYPAFSHEECQLRKRVFWSLYSIDRYICHALGLPLGIQDDDLDVCLLSRERHVTKEQHPPDDRLYLLEIIAKHAEIRGMIIELRNKSISYSQKNQDQAVIITAKSTKWWNEVEEFLEANDAKSDILAESHRTTLMVLKHENIIALNRPILAVSKKSSGYNAALQDCIGAARSIINILWRALHSRQPDGSERLPLLWHSYTWAIWMSAYLIFYATNENEVRHDISAKLTDRCLEILEHLALRGSMWPEACAAAIRDLRTQTDKRQASNEQLQTELNDRRGSIGGLGNRNDRMFERRPSIQRAMTHNGTTSMPSPSIASGMPREPTSAPTGREQAGGWPQMRGARANSISEDGTATSREANAAYNLANGQYVQMGPPGDVAAASTPNPNQQSWVMGDPGYGNYQVPVINPSPEPSDPFYGFDIPFWYGADQFSLMSNEWT